MRTLIAAAALATLGAAWPGCASHSKISGGLGKVVVYRNGVAYYERRAQVNGQDLLLTVPAEQIDDFLKSLTIRDAKTGESLPVSFPSRGSSGSSGLVEMVVRLPPNAPADVILTYITESPAWKPSYRISMGDKGEVELEGWAIVDNTSGETWEEVMIGVGSSSALSFRYDLWSIRDVRRQTLSQEDRFAVAPPKGASPYAEDKTANQGVLGEIAAEEINVPTSHPDWVAASGSAAGDDGDDDDDEYDSRDWGGESADEPVPNVDPSPSSPASDRSRVSKRESEKARKERQLEKAKRDQEHAVAQQRYDRNERMTSELAERLKSTNENVVIEGYAQHGEIDADDRALDRANTLRNQLITRGVPPARLTVRSAGVVEGRPAGVRLVAQEGAKADAAGPPGKQQPVGESHFQSATPITVARGSSTMVSIVKETTPGRIVYLYDAESERGNANFAFRAVRLENPTDYTLEAGPVTVYGQGRFIGEGLTDPIPPNSSALIPFALDRQVIIERKVDRRDQIAGLIKLSRGALSAEMQHVRDTELTITNRMHQAVSVFVRHSVGEGWELVDSPKAERLGSAHLFPVELGAGKTTTLRIREQTPLVRTLDLNSDETLDMVSAFITSAEEHKALAAKIEPLLALHRKMADHKNAILTLREQMRDYRARMDELHAQIVTLKAVKSGGELTRHLKAKMQEISERVQKATIDVVTHQEEVMLTRIKFQDAIAELSLNEKRVATQK